MNAIIQFWCAFILFRRYKIAVYYYFQLSADNRTRHSWEKLGFRLSNIIVSFYFINLSKIISRFIHFSIKIAII